MKKLSLLLIILLTVGCKDSRTVSKIDKDTEQWISLFNGENLDNWDIKIANHPVGDNYNNTFRVEDSMIRVAYDNYQTFDNSFGHLYYKTPYSYYKIKLDYRFTGEQVNGGEDWAKRNSGIMLHSQSASSNSIGQYFPVSIEFQLLGGLNDGNERPTGNLCTPGTIVEMDGKIVYEHCINSTAKTYYGDQWVHVEAIVLGNEKVFHIVENDTVLVYNKPMIGGGLLNRGNDSEWKTNGVDNKDEWLARDQEPLEKGYIALQAESHPIDFKNIELLDLCGCMDKKATNYKSYYVKEDNSKCLYD